MSGAPQPPLTANRLHALTSRAIHQHVARHELNVGCFSPYGLPSARAAVPLPSPAPSLSGASPAPA
eukprot:3715848-Rhodomonas_salina.1